MTTEYIMNDWKGNQIKVGDIVIKIAIGTMYDGGTFQTIYSIGPGMTSANDKPLRETHVGEEFTQPESYLWEPMGEYLVKEPGNTIMCSFGSLSEIPINQLDFFLGLQAWEIICIKGVSDNEQEYYKHKFTC